MIYHKSLCALCEGLIIFVHFFEFFNHFVHAFELTVEDFLVVQLAASDPFTLVFPVLDLLQCEELELAHVRLFCPESCLAPVVKTSLVACLCLVQVLDVSVTPWCVVKVGHLLVVNPTQPHMLLNKF